MHSVEIIQRKNCRHNIIFATFVQIRDVEIKKLCSSGTGRERLLASLPSTVSSLHVQMTDQYWQNEAENETIPWTQTDPTLNDL